MKTYNISVYHYSPNEYKHIPNDLWLAYARIDHKGKSYVGTWNVEAQTLAKAKKLAINKAKKSYEDLGHKILHSIES